MVKTEESPKKKKENDLTFFKQTKWSRPSRLIMREAFPKLTNEGEVKRQVPGYNTVQSNQRLISPTSPSTLFSKQSTSIHDNNYTMKTFTDKS